MTDRLGDKIRLQHVLDAINEIETYTKGVDFAQFSSNSMLFSACVRQLEIVGEAANRLTDKTVEVTIYDPLSPIPIVWKKMQIMARQKAGEKFNLQGTFTCLYCCASNAQVIAKIKATYN